MDPQKNSSGTSGNWDQAKQSWHGGSAWDSAQLSAPTQQPAAQPTAAPSQNRTGIFDESQPASTTEPAPTAEQIATPRQNSYSANESPRSVQKNDHGGYAVVPPLQQNPQVNSGHNPYEFIMQPSNIQTPKGLGDKSSFIKRALFTVGGIILLFLLISFGIKAFGPKDIATPALVAIVQEQQEIVRVAAKGQTVPSERTRAFAANTLFSVGTDQYELTKYLAAKKAAPKGKALSAKRSAETDKILTDAKESNTLDSALQQSLTAQLTDYSANLSATYKKLASKKAKAIIEHSYATTQLLLKQSSSTPAGEPAP